MLNEKEYTHYMHLIKGFVDILEANHIEYIMADGTLLGSYVMHDMLAWDDDVDFMVNSKEYPKLKKLYQNVKFGQVYTVHGYHDPFDEWSGKQLNKIYNDSRPYGVYRRPVLYHKHKIYFKNERVIPRVKWRWPFIDVKFYKQTHSHVFKHDKGKHPRTPVGDFYPLHRRPLGQLWLPSPHRTASVLREKYKFFKCKGSNWSHQLEQLIPKSQRVKHECSQLSNGMYPSVEHVPRKDGTTAELVWHHKIPMYAALIKAPSDGYVPSYSI